MLQQFSNDKMLNKDLLSFICVVKFEMVFTLRFTICIHEIDSLSW